MLLSDTALTKDQVLSAGGEMEWIFLRAGVEEDYRVVLLNYRCKITIGIIGVFRRKNN